MGLVHRLVHVGGQGRRLLPSLNDCAHAMAQRKLVISAWPLPARDSAVPWSTEVRTNGNPKVTLTAVLKCNAFGGAKAWSWYMAKMAS